MIEYRYKLEKYKGRGTRYKCPQCGKGNEFSRYIDTVTGEHLADHVGRCNREEKCGYHLAPKDYLDEVPSNGRSQNSNPKVFIGDTKKNIRRRDAAPSTIPSELLIGTLRNYESNNLIRFLMSCGLWDAKEIEKVTSQYLLGTHESNAAIFWQISQHLEIRSGKIMAYDPHTGHRRKDHPPYFIHSRMTREGILPKNFEFRMCFFGEHLLHKNPFKSVAIVESEKTAVIASLYSNLGREFVWLASGARGNLSLESLTRIGQGRRVILYPDADSFNEWSQKASLARDAGLDVAVSELVERHANDGEKAEGRDLADFLLEASKSAT